MKPNDFVWASAGLLAAFVIGFAVVRIVIPSLVNSHTDGGLILAVLIPIGAILGAGWFVAKIKEICEPEGDSE